MAIHVNVERKVCIVKTRAQCTSTTLELQHSSEHRKTGTHNLNNPERYTHAARVQLDAYVEGKECTSTRYPPCCGSTNTHPPCEGTAHALTHTCAGAHERWYREGHDSLGAPEWPALTRPQGVPPSLCLRQRQRTQGGTSLRTQQTRGSAVDHWRPRTPTAREGPGRPPSHPAPLHARSARCRRPRARGARGIQLRPGVGRRRHGPWQETLRVAEEDRDTEHTTHDTSTHFPPYLTLGDTLCFCEAYGMR